MYSSAQTKCENSNSIEILLLLLVLFERDGNKYLYSLNDILIMLI